MNKQKAYSVLIAMLLASNGIKNGDSSDTNPFQKSTPTVLLFVTAIFCHVLTSTAVMNSATTVITFHLSGIVGCQTLLWILLADLLRYCIINMLVLLVASICFFNYIIANITQLFGASPSNEMPTIPPQPLEDQV